MIVVRWNYASSVAHVRAPRYRLPTTRLDLQQRRRSFTAGTSSRVLPGTTQRWSRLPLFSPNRSPTWGAGRRAPSASCGRPRRPTSSARVRPASLRKDPVFTGWLDQSGHMTMGSARRRGDRVSARHVRFNLGFAECGRQAKLPVRVLDQRPITSARMKSAAPPIDQPNSSMEQRQEERSKTIRKYKKGLETCYEQKDVELRHVQRQGREKRE